MAQVAQADDAECDTPDRHDDPWVERVKLVGQEQRAVGRLGQCRSTVGRRAAAYGIGYEAAQPRLDDRRAILLQPQFDQNSL